MKKKRKGEKRRGGEEVGGEGRMLVGWVKENREGYSHSEGNGQVTFHYERLKNTCWCSVTALCSCNVRTTNCTTEHVTMYGTVGTVRA